MPRGRDGGTPPGGIRPGGVPVLQPILTTWPPDGHSFGPLPLAGAMLQFET